MSGLIITATSKKISPANVSHHMARRKDMTTEETAASRAHVQGIVTRHCEFWGVSEYDLPRGFRDAPSLSPYRCPCCQNAGNWRRGQEFEHMMRCGKCNIVWTPDSVLRLQQTLADELAGCNGDGI